MGCCCHVFRSVYNIRMAVYSSFSGLENYALAQHSFIKSVQVEPNVSTTHHTLLGTHFSLNHLLCLSLGTSLFSCFHSTHCHSLSH